MIRVERRRRPITEVCRSWSRRSRRCFLDHRQYVSIGREQKRPTNTGNMERRGGRQDADQLVSVGSPMP